MTTDSTQPRTGQEVPLLLGTEPPRTFGFADQADRWTDAGCGPCSVGGRCGG
ncbi:hypothetical protein [Nocardia sp. NPDC058480]|uniref:hypothetical protein n=1 Tax=unclassified Nocardia TaxID=2637762 RepID=UPI0036662F73